MVRSERLTTPSLLLDNVIQISYTSISRRGKLCYEERRFKRAPFLFDRHSAERCPHHAPCIYSILSTLYSILYKVKVEVKVQ